MFGSMANVSAGNALRPAIAQAWCESHLIIPKIAEIAATGGAVIGASVGAVLGGVGSACVTKNIPLIAAATAGTALVTAGVDAALSAASTAAAYALHHGETVCDLHGPGGANAYGGIAADASFNGGTALGIGVGVVVGVVAGVMATAKFAKQASAPSESEENPV
jgi:hypothetical protein